MDYIRPPRLRPGDKVAVVSTSWGGPHTFPHVFERGLSTLRDAFGLEVTEYPTARMSPAELHADPQRRAEDLNVAFADSSVSAILSCIGGSDSARILPFLDPTLAVAHPKILMGYSDTGTQLAFYHHAGLVTFNGPGVMAGFAQLEHFEAAAHHIRSLLFEPTSSYVYRPYDAWAPSYRDWRGSTDPSATEDLVPHDGWHWLQAGSPASGRLYGGCIGVLESLKGTRFWPDETFWNDRILFLETSEEAPGPEQVGRWLRNYGVQGVFAHLRGLLVGRAREYTEEAKAELDRTVLEVVVGEFGADRIPIVSNLDFGHTDPQWIMPLGVRMEIDSDAGTLTLVEPAVA